MLAVRMRRLISSHATPPQAARQEVLKLEADVAELEAALGAAQLSTVGALCDHAMVMVSVMRWGGVMVVRRGLPRGSWARHLCGST